MPKYELEISGLDCAACAQRVEQALREVRGVGETRVAAPEGKAWVEVAADEPRPEALAVAVAAAGYEVESCRRVD